MLIKDGGFAQPVVGDNCHARRAVQIRPARCALFLAQITLRDASIHQTVNEGQAALCLFNAQRAANEHCFALTIGSDQFHKPVLCDDLVVVNKGQEISVLLYGFLGGAVAAEGDAQFGLVHVVHRGSICEGSETLHILSRARFIVIFNDEKDHLSVFRDIHLPPRCDQSPKHFGAATRQGRDDDFQLLCTTGAHLRVLDST